MDEPTYTVFVRVPIPRGDFVDPPPVSWNTTKDEELWRILSGATQQEIDWNQVADDFNVPVDFLLRQVDYLTERHASQVRAQVRKATAAAKSGGSSNGPLPAPPGSDSAAGIRSLRRNSRTMRTVGSGSATPINASQRPVVSRNASGATAVPRDMGSASPSPANSGRMVSAADQPGRRRLSSLPIATNTDDQEVPARRAETDASPGAEQDTAKDDRSPSPGPAESSSTTTSDDESMPAQSRIIRRPPRFQSQDTTNAYADDEDDDDDSSEPAFQPYKPPAGSAQTSAHDLSSTLRGDGVARTNSSRRPTKQSSRDQRGHNSQTSDSDTSSAMQPSCSAPKPHRAAGPLSPRRTAELAGRSSGGRGSHEGSDGTPSMGSSFSDLDDASVTQSALEEALASHMNRGMGSRFSISQAFRSRYTPGGGQYFINDDDELRSLEDPDQYFRHFFNRNMRVNMRRRFAIDSCLEKVIHERLSNLNLVKTPLPLDTPSTMKHVPVFIDADLPSRTRVVVIFGETSNMLGQLAGRVVTGEGGISQGSMVSVVEELRRQHSGPDDLSPPGILVANTGQLYWWPEGSRALTVGASSTLPLPSLVHAGWRFSAQANEVRGHETPQRHVQSVFDDALTRLLQPGARVDIVAIGDTCDYVERFLDAEASWAVWGARLGFMLLIDPICEAGRLSNVAFKDFLSKRSRGYLRSTEPVDTPLATPEGNPHLCIGALGMPCYSSAEPNYTECILVRSLPHILGYLGRNALDPGAVNEPIAHVPTTTPPDDEVVEEEDGFDDAAWAQVDDAQKPDVEYFDSKILDLQRKQERLWNEF
ncbi:Arb2 domain [Geosmithia morbida]|uniref:Autophagy-related protein 29 n=1 Tax=Geosmithia morbida TaxID=1094350 RepID=A0A9P4YWZ9_9HYPO|nr:Arb2 domain [Geosmithia morbida]KAF4124395.1 Arb2 domain [Geosmithia morbida]